MLLTAPGQEHAGERGKFAIIAIALLHLGPASGRRRLCCRIEDRTAAQ